MSAEYKILNDPVYGFTTLPYSILYDIVEHPYFQRLRRIKQVGLSHFVYPGAVHTRFQHALGALHLTRKAIEVLQSKDVEITEEEAISVQLAILLHDIGHGPYSHALEGHFIPVSHERLTLAYMEKLNEEFEGKLSLAIKIFKNQYSKTFLHQLISGQLDMDRMDYLIRDSYYTGVAEGIIGYDRIIKMLNVYDNQLVVEEKGLYSVEKFLLSRKLMYWQVYLHKTALSAEKMLVRLFEYYKSQPTASKAHLSPAFEYFLSGPKNPKSMKTIPLEMLEWHASIDDADIDVWIKSLIHSKNPVLRILSRGLTNRKLFRVYLQKEPLTPAEIKEIEFKLLEKLESNQAHYIKDLIIQGEETNRLYNATSPEINILMKSGKIQPLSLETDAKLDTQLLRRYYLCHPKLQ